MKPAKQVTSMSSGPSMAQAMNTAPAVKPEVPIAGYAKLKEAPGKGRTGASGAGTPDPAAKVTSRGVPAANKGGPASAPKRMPGGPSRAGPRGTQGGTSSPKYGPGPSGLGQSGTKFPPIG